jgi:hypothetical protein
MAQVVLNWGELIQFCALFFAITKGWVQINFRLDVIEKKLETFKNESQPEPKPLSIGNDEHQRPKRCDNRGFKPHRAARKRFNLFGWPAKP